MNKILVIRFGTETPLSKEIPIFFALSDKMRFPAIVVPLRGVGVLSLFYTNQSVSTVRDMYQKIAKDTGDTLPVVVIDLEGRDAVVSFTDYIDFDKLIEKFDAEIEQFKETSSEEEDEEPEPEQANPRTVTTLQLDDLLDLINTRGGIEKLTAEERARLEELTK